MAVMIGIIFFLQVIIIKLNNRGESPLKPKTMEDIFKQLGSYFQINENTIDKKTVDYCCNLNEITGQITAYNQALNWLHEPGVNSSDLSQLIHNEIDKLILTSNKLQDGNKN
jgi:hypothetical protein